MLTARSSRASSSRADLIDLDELTVPNGSAEALFALYPFFDLVDDGELYGRRWYLRIDPLIDMHGLETAWRSWIWSEPNANGAAVGVGIRVGTRKLRALVGARR